jgi:microcystin-dependent protein
MANFTQFTDSVSNVQALDNQPTSSAAVVKAAFDKAGEDIVDYINDTLIAELEATSASTKIGCTGAHATIQAFITATEAAGSGSTPGAGVVTNAMMATDVKIGSLAALTTTAKASIQAAINELVTTIGLASHTIPSGLIATWSGSIASIPTGWALCDGTAGTPDLRDKFIMGAGTTAVGATGGANNTTLTTTQLPAHTHTGTTASGGAHTHTVDSSTTSMGTVSGSAAPYSTPATQTTSSAGAHTHTITTDSAGTGAAYDSRPSFYALAYIQKT